MKISNSSLRLSRAEVQSAGCVYRGHWRKVALQNAWYTRLSIALQQGNAKCLLQAGRVRGLADFVGDSDWEDDVDDLLRDAAATAGFGGFEA